MFCRQCGKTIEDNSAFCQNCGTPVSAPNSAPNPAPEFLPPPSAPQYNAPVLDPGRGVLILILGIFSLFFGLFTGIPAWIMGNTDLKRIDRGEIPISERGKTQAGKILGIIGTSWVILIIVPLFIVVGINLFQSSAVDANRNAVIQDLNTLCAKGQEFYKKPASLGGGGNTYTGFTMPTGLSTTANGTYAPTVAAQTLIFAGTGLEKGNDGTTNVKATATVTNGSGAPALVINN